MAFKKETSPEVAPDSPEQILLQLPRRKIPGVLLHQGQMMQRYVAEAQNVSDVALQLPTGSGKTLVGLLIGEWRRRKHSERVVYLCPTRQLVNQVVAQAENQYGLSVLGFTGPKSGYDPSAVAEYRSCKRIAVTTYNSLFNVNPFFDSADIIIVDDAHAAESYISSMWSVCIDRFNKDHAQLHAHISEVLLKPLLDATDYARLTGELDESLTDVSWVDKLPSPHVAEIHEELVALMDAHVGDAGDLHFQWRLIRGHLDACHLYLSSHEILIRPLIAPTWTHDPFTVAKQRIFMSATLGEGGDLERMTGRSNIHRLPVPDGWDRQGIGRRFFIFPEMSLDEPGTTRFRHELMRKVPRSVVLVPSDRVRREYESDALGLGLAVFDATSIEESKAPFVASTSAVAIFANRYDGVDFPGDECRLLFVDGLPKTTNAQERFLVAKMGAGTLLRERIQTRVIQAVGRCTRSLQDYSAVVITGSDMTDYLSNPSRRAFFHPELQAELDFGVEQSTGTKIKDLVDNFDIFIRNDAEWEEINQTIIAKRNKAIRQLHPGISELASVVSHEIEYQSRMWQGDYESALESAGRVLANLNGEDLRGYRATWHYLAATAAWYGEKSGLAALGSKARTHFARARDASTGIRWLGKLTRYQSSQPAEPGAMDAVEGQIERLEALLLKLGTTHDGKYAKHEKNILEGLAASEANIFEEAQKRLGEILGYRAGKHESDASPDPWWSAGDYCFVFEDHSDAKPTSSLGATKARQVAGHPKWMAENVNLTQIARETKFLPVLVTPVSRAESGAFPHLADVAFWSLADFRTWASHALAEVRALRRTLGEDGDLVWRADAQRKFEENEFDAPSLYRRLIKCKASTLLKRE